MEIKTVRKKASDYGVPIIRSESHMLLESQVNETQPKHILEIGMAIGFSGTIMLKTCNADLVTIEHNNNYIKQAKNNFKKEGLLNRIKIVKGDCLVALANLVSNKNYHEFFDFVFLDGPKAQYQNMLDLILILLKPGGTLVADNVLFRGYVNGENKPITKRYKTIIDRLNNFIEKCKTHPDLTNFTLSTIEDGMIFVNKRGNNEK